MIDSDGNLAEISFEVLAKVLGANVDDTISSNNSKQLKVFITIIGS